LVPLKGLMPNLFWSRFFWVNKYYWYTSMYY
jgi:hypothetical protein